MKEIVFYILMVYNSNHSEAVWTFSPKVTKVECEQLQAEMRAAVSDSDLWHGRAVKAPQFSKCVPMKEMNREPTKDGY